MRARRVAAISLSSLRLEIARQNEPTLAERPLAIVVARENSAIENEASLLGNTRIDEASHEAKYLGISPGMTIAAARAKSADLSVRVIAERAARDALARIAELALAFGATVAFDMETHVVWADVTGCAHIHDPNPGRASGMRAPLDRVENILANALYEKVTALGHDASVAIADGPRVAAMFSKVMDAVQDDRVLVVPREKTKDAIFALPVVALPLDDAAKHWLARLGIKTAAELAKLPRASLASRLGSQSRALFSLFDASDTTPLDPYRPPETPIERVELEYGIEGGEALLFVMRTLTTRLSARLEGRALGATEITMTFELDNLASQQACTLDAARNAGKTRRSRAERTIVLAAPIRNASELFAVVRARIEAAERRRETFQAPILAVELAATKLSRAPSRNLDLLQTESRAARLLPQLAAELTADLGENRAGMLVLESSLNPLERVRLVPYEERNESLSVSEDVPEPSRFLQGDACELMMVDGPTRLISRTAWIAWWKRPIDLESRRTTAFDWVTGYCSEAKATAWVEIDGTTGRRILRGWE